MALASVIGSIARTRKRESVPVVMTIELTFTLR
jgi:hypothetical protein